MTTLQTYTTAGTAIRGAKRAAAKCSMDLVLVDVTATRVGEATFTANIVVDQPLSSISDADREILAAFNIDALPEPEPEVVDPADTTPVPPKASKYIRERSDHVGVTAEVWGVADSMPGAKRSEVIEACRVRGIAFGTARTQYQKWRSAQANRGAITVADDAAEDGGE